MAHTVSDPPSEAAGLMAAACVAAAAEPEAPAGPLVAADPELVPQLATRRPAPTRRASSLLGLARFGLAGVVIDRVCMVSLPRRLLAAAGAQGG